MSRGSTCHGSKSTLINPTETKVCHFGHGATRSQAESLKTVNKWEKNIKAKLVSKKGCAANYPSKCYLIRQTSFLPKHICLLVFKRCFPFLRITTRLLVPGNQHLYYNRLILCVRSSAFFLLNSTDSSCSSSIYKHSTQPYKQRFKDQRAHVISWKLSSLQQQQATARVNTGHRNQGEPEGSSPSAAYVRNNTPCF